PHLSRFDLAGRSPARARLARRWILFEPTQSDRVAADDPRPLKARKRAEPARPGLLGAVGLRFAKGWRTTIEVLLQSCVFERIAVEGIDHIFAVLPFTRRSG